MVELSALFRVVRRLAKPAFWLALPAVAVLSLLPLSGPMVPGGDKTQHLLAYFGLTLLASLGRVFRGVRQGLLFVLVLVLFSGAIELVQGYVGRYPDLLDLLSNGCGTLSGFLLGLLLDKLDRNTEPV